MNIRNLLFVVLLMTVSLSTGGAGAQEHPNQPPNPMEPYRRLMMTADHLYTLRADLNTARQAYDTYKKAVRQKPDAYEALWKTAKTGFYLMEVIKDKKQKKAIVNECVRFAKAAVKLKPGGVEGHFWLGVNYTKVGEIKGILKALFLIRPIKKEMRKVIALDDTFEGGGAYVVLARVYAMVPGILGGSKKEARTLYQKARTLSPANTLNLLFMAENYWNLKEKVLAIKTLEDLVAMEPEPRWVPESRLHKREARRLLRSYRNK